MAPSLAQPVWVGPPPAVTAYPPAIREPASPGPLPIEAPTDVHFRVSVAESFLSALMAREVTDSGPIRDCLLGADLFGEQFTATQLSVDCRPCETQARLLLRLVGTVTDRTVGVTRPAAIRSEGNHRFELTKQVDFDGRQFTTRTPAAWVTPQITYRGASTIVSGVPVIGPIGSAIALNEAERRRPVAEHYALRRVTDTAAPRFNQEVDGRLSRANQRLNELGPLLTDRLGLSPAGQILTSSDDWVHYGLQVTSTAVGVIPGRTASARLDGPVFLGPIDEEPPAAEEQPEPLAVEPVETRRAMSSAPKLAGNAATVLVHETFVNHLLENLALGGLELPDRHIDHVMEGVREVLASRSWDGFSFRSDESATPEYATVLLDRQRPVSLRFDDGQAVVTLRAGFQVLLGQTLPIQRVEIRFRVSAEGRQVSLEPDSVTISALSADDDGTLSVLARPMIRQQIEKRLQPLVIERDLLLEIPNLKPTTMTIREVVLQNGWLALTFD